MLEVSVVKTPITPSGSFSVETLTGLTLSWKTELNRSISIMEDRIPGGLQQCHKTCFKKGGCRRRRACIFWRWHHRGDVVFQTGGSAYDTNKTFTVTDSLISQLFVVTFIHSIYVWIALIWGFPTQLSLWKLVYWLWRYKLNEVCNNFFLLFMFSWTSPTTLSLQPYGIPPIT